MPFSFTRLEALVPFAHRRARRETFDGRPGTRWLVGYCLHRLVLRPDLSAVVLFTRDVCHHTAGWWKNPDYERCLHLSLSFAGEPGDVPLPYQKRDGERIARAFFGDDIRRCWLEPPYSPQGKTRDVWHYRVFCDPAWRPITPRKEVYSRELTEAGWKSFSAIHGAKETPS